MKKKICLLLLSATVAMSLVACGSDEGTKEPTDTSVTSEVESELDTETEATEESTEVVIDEEGVVLEDVSYTLDDLTAAVPTDNFVIGVEQSGFSLSVAKSGGNAAIYTSYVSEEQSVVMDMYVIGTDMYSYIDDGTGNIGYFHAVADSEANVATDMTGDMSTSFTGSESVEYVITKRYEGVVYDVVRVSETTYMNTESVSDVSETDVVADESVVEVVAQSDYYINTETGMVDYIFTTDSTSDAETVCTIVEIDGIELPADFASAEVQEVTGEDIAMQLMAVMFLSAEDMQSTDVPADTVIEGSDITDDYETVDEPKISEE